MHIITVKPGIEHSALLECIDAGINATILQSGILAADKINLNKDPNLCFPSWYLCDGNNSIFERSNDVLIKAADWYCESIRFERIEKHWPLAVLVFSENGYILDVNKSCSLQDQLKKKVSRVAKLAVTGYPSANIVHRGLFIIETDKKEAYFCRSAMFSGPKRMKFDPDAPSRSYLKIEEAFTIIGSAPLSGETVVDLGAAPGGWSYAAAKRGAKVFAVDNGPLKKGAAQNPLITHLKEDAFGYMPQKPVDWLFCDMVEDPFRVVKMVRSWLKKKLCKSAVVNCKFGYADPFKVLSYVKSSEGFSEMACNIVCRHLYHDRDEFTVMMRSY